LFSWKKSNSATSSVAAKLSWGSGARTLTVKSVVGKYFKPGIAHNVLSLYCRCIFNSLVESTFKEQFENDVVDVILLFCNVWDVEQ
jgi:hypothetical protein